MITLNELKEIKEKTQKEVCPRRVHVCGGTGCTSSGSPKLIAKLEEEIKKNGLENEVEIVKTGCFGLCALGPIMIVHPENSFYSMVKEEDIPRIVEEHLKNGNPVKDLLYDDTTKGDHSLPLEETNCDKKQHRGALRNCGE
ncbi:MAG: (2Fe-2S) ferredoxin domain-containing protein, partial [Clostridia bacterium]|nr:(2Fe-2S) ferredoxin domain-containing protein [Clostridia bacterium]